VRRDVVTCPHRQPLSSIRPRGPRFHVAVVTEVMGSLPQAGRGNTSSRGRGSRDHRLVAKACANLRDGESWVVEHFVVGESEHFEPGGVEQRIARVVGACDFGAEVVAAVDFDDEPGVEAHEVDDERAKRLMSTELGATDASSADEVPERGLGGRGCASLGSGTEGLGAKERGHAPLSTRAPRKLRTSRSPPLPLAGEGQG